MVSDFESYLIMGPLRYWAITLASYSILIKDYNWSIKFWGENELSKHECVEELVAQILIPFTFLLIRVWMNMFICLQVWLCEEIETLIVFVHTFGLGLLLSSYFHVVFFTFSSTTVLEPLLSSVTPFTTFFVASPVVSPSAPAKHQSSTGTLLSMPLFPPDLVMNVGT